MGFIMSATTSLLERFEELIEIGKTLLPFQNDLKYLAKKQKWMTSCQHILERTIGKESIYYSNFRALPRLGNQEAHITHGLALMEGAREEIEKGTAERTDIKQVSSTSSQTVTNKVFIVHGIEDKQALLLQKYLKDKLKVNAVMFDDLRDKGRTIIEQLEYIRDHIYYAFVIVTPDDVGCLREEIQNIARMVVGLKNVGNEIVTKIFENLHERARQNVVFELGLFIGALGRENVCCLLQKDVKERPSDIDGILYKSFDRSVTEIFHEIAEELE